MKKLILIVFLGTLFLTSCKKDDFTYDYPDVNKLLISVTRIDGDTEYSTNFKYDSLNRLVEIHTIYPEDLVFTDSFYYNDKGQLFKKVSGDYETTYSYHSSGFLTEQIVHYKSQDSNNEWNAKTEYRYKNGKISKGIEYSTEGEVLHYISYKYDARGNTLEKIVRPADGSDINMIEIKFKYDTKNNPHAVSGLSMLNGYNFMQNADIKQVNNPVYSSYSNIIMSSLPPEYKISYEYNVEGLPVKAVMNNVRFSGQGPVNVVFEYRDIEK